MLQIVSLCDRIAQTGNKRATVLNVVLRDFITRHLQQTTNHVSASLSNTIADLLRAILCAVLKTHFSSAVFLGCRLCVHGASIESDQYET